MDAHRKRLLLLGLGIGASGLLGWGIVVRTKLAPARVTHRSAAAALPGRPSRLVRPQPRRSLPAKASLTQADHANFKAWQAAQIGTEHERPELLDNLIATLTDENAAETIQAMSGDELKSPFGLAALTRWLRADPVQAAIWIADQKDATEDQAILVAHSLDSNPEVLKDYCATLGSPQWRTDVLIGACLDLSPRDPQTALDLAAHISPGVAQTNVTLSIAFDWSLADPVASLAWIAQVTDPLLRSRLLGCEAKAVAVSDPDLAADLAITSIDSPATLSETLPDIIESWAAKAPSTAADWVLRHSTGDLRASALEIVARNWKQVDTAQEAAWAETLSADDRQGLSL